MDSIGLWLKRARHFRGFTAKQLADRSQLSLNYIQRIEGGDRNMSEKASKAIFDALGFTSKQISFDSTPTLKRIDELIAENGENAFCSLRSVSIANRKYYTSCEMVDLSQIKSQSAPSNILRLRYARNEVEAQRDIYEDGDSFRSNEPVNLIDDDGKAITRVHQVK